MAPTAKDALNEDLHQPRVSWPGGRTSHDTVIGSLIPGRFAALQRGSMRVSAAKPNIKRVWTLSFCIGSSSGGVFCRNGPPKRVNPHVLHITLLTSTRQFASETTFATSPLFVDIWFATGIVFQLPCLEPRRHVWSLACCWGARLGRMLF